MKAIEVTIKAVFEIPDDWEIIDNGDAIKTRDRLNIFTLDYLEENEDKEFFQSGDDTFYNAWIDRLETETCQIIELKSEKP